VAANEVEHSEPVVVADDGLAVDGARADGQRVDRGRSELETVRRIVAVLRDQADAATAPMRQDPRAIVLDLVNSARVRRRRAGRSRQAWFEGMKGRLRAQPAPELARGEGIVAKIRVGALESSQRLPRESETRLFDFQWLARPPARSHLLLFTQGSPTVHKSVLP
jgi:hypothetical protein